MASYLLAGQGGWRLRKNYKQMKQIILIIAGILLLLSVVACSQRDKSKILEQYKYTEETSVLTILHKNKLGSWIKEGMTCYGIIMVRDENGIPKRMKEIHAKVISIHSESIKMEALEDIIINPIVGCNKVSLKKGECWDEVDGELFKTKEETIQYIDDHYPGLRMKH